MLNSNYLIREAEGDDEKEQVLDNLKKYHRSEDPIYQAFSIQQKNRLTSKDEERSAKDSRELIFQNICFVAIQKETNKVAGSIIIVPYELIHSKDYRYPQIILPNHSKMTKYFNACINKMYAVAHFYENFPNCKKFLVLRNMCVHGDHRGKGLAKALLGKSIEFAKLNDLKVIHSCFTLAPSKAAAKSVGFVEVVVCDLNKVQDTDGRTVFADSTSNNLTSIMAYRCV